MRLLLVLLALAIAGLSGCLNSPTNDVVLSRPPTLLDATQDRLGWSGTVGERAGACTATTCNEHTFTVAAAAEPYALLTLAAAWPFEAAEMGLDGSDPSFQFEAEGPAGSLGEARLGWLGAVLHVANPEPGNYTMRIWGTRTGGPYEAGAVLLAQLPERPANEELLPDLITMPITGLSIALPDGPLLPAATHPAWEPLAGVLGIKGCSMDEWAESQTQRCLRFSNGIANMGLGPVEVRLPLQDAIAQAAGQPEFQQRIYLAGGGHRHQSAGPAAFHPIHGHYHFEGFAQTTLYAYDLDAGARGEVAVAGEKLGYCFIDIGITHVLHTPIQAPAYGVEGCLTPVEERTIVSGLQPGWFDLYWSDLSHQYIDITGLADGVYELESIANVDGKILEADATNNAASVVFRLTGDSIEVLKQLA